MRNLFDWPSKKLFLQHINNLKKLKTEDATTFQLTLELLEFAMQDSTAKLIQHYAIDLNFGSIKSKFLIDCSSPENLYDFLIETGRYDRIKNVSNCPFCDHDMDFNMSTRSIYCDNCCIGFKNNLLFIDELIKEWNSFVKKYKITATKSKNKTA